MFISTHYSVIRKRHSIVSVLAELLEILFETRIFSNMVEQKLRSARDSLDSNFTKKHSQVLH